MKKVYEKFCKFEQALAIFLLSLITVLVCGAHPHVWLPDQLGAGCRADCLCVAGVYRWRYFRAHDRPDRR